MASKDITIRIIGDASKATGAFRDVEVSAGKADTSLSRIGTTAAGFAIGGALTQLPGILMDGAKGATEDAAAMDKLKTAVTNTGASYDTYGGSIDDAIKKGQDLAFTDGETADALSTLISLTGDTDEGMRRLALAQDLARGTGMDLETAAKLLGKTSEENTAALSRYGIQLGENATAQDVLNAVDAKFGGQAGTFAESDAGKLAKSQQAAGELAETFGAFLIPAMLLASQTATAVGNVLANQVAPAIASVLSFISPVVSLIADNFVPALLILSPLLAGAAVVIGTALVGAFVAWATATWAQVAAALALNAAMLPWIAALAAIGVAIALLYVAWDTNFLGIRDITMQFIDWVTPYISTALDTIVSVVTTVLGAIQAAWGVVWPALQVVIEVVWLAISTYVTTYIAVVQTVIETALSIIQTVWNTVFPAIQAVVETVFPIIATVAQTYIGIFQTAIETGITAVKWAFDNVFMPIQGIVSDVFSTIAGLVTSLFDPAIAAIGAGVDSAKWFFDNVFLPIQGVVEDVFNTIVGLVDTLWNGATGAVSLIGTGVDTIKGFFDGIYDTMYGFGKDIVQGLIDGVAALYGTLEGWFNKITGLMDIDVPGFSPPYDAGYEQGQRFVTGLSDGVRDATPLFDRSIGDVTGRFDLGPGIGSGNTGGNTPPRFGNFTDPNGDAPGWYRPPYQPPGVVSENPPFIGPSGHFDNPQNVGGGKSVGSISAREIEDAVARGVKRGLGGAI